MTLVTRTMPWLLALSALAAATVSLLPTIALGAATGDYDEARNRAQLEKIGRALQLYRAEYGFVEPSRRRTYSDAGLPPRIAQWAFEVGKPWSLALSDIKPATYRQPEPGTFSQMYWGPERFGVHGDLSNHYRTRGERLIVLMDLETDPGMWRSADGMREALVLRLDGSVDKIRFNHQVFLDWSTK
jgi:hypothetical protein